MADNTQGSSSETESQEPQDQNQSSTTSETEGNGQGDGSTTEPQRLPDDHPLVKAYAAQKSRISSQNSEMAELRSKSAKVSQLEDELQKRPTEDALKTLQTRYDRLEAFLAATGGPLSKALDSRNFTRSLFETDEDVAQLASKWLKDNPTATSQALGSTSSEPGKAKVDPNDLLRAAFKTN